MDKEATLEAVEASLDAAEETIEAVEQSVSKLARLARSHKVHILLAGFVGCGVGATAAYFITRNKLQTKFDKILEEEIEKERTQVRRLNKTGEFADPVALAERLHPEVEKESEEESDSEGLENYQEKISNLGYKVESPKEKEEDLEGPDVEVNVVNVFSSSDEFDLELEKENRSEHQPYVLHHDEYLHNEEDYDQTTLTYFEGDDVLIDEEQKIIENTNDIVGDANLLRFGHGSKDNNVVYIRNDSIQVDFEVHKSTGKYAEEVLGFIEHSDRPRNRGPHKFRSYQD